MRIATFALVVFGACGGGDQPAKPTGKHVRLDDLPFTEWIGLPMSGDAVVMMDVQGQDDLRTAKGRIEVTCPSGCRIGDDKTKLVPPAGARASAFVGDGIYVGHLDLGRVDIALSIGGGTATIDRWEVASQDLTLRLSGSAKLGKRLDEAQLDLCLRFAATPALKARDAKTFALLETTGGARAADSLYNITVTGRADHPHVLARVCDGTAPAAPRAPTMVTVVPDLPPPPMPAPDPDRAPPAPAPDLSGLATATSATTFDVDVAKLERVFADPMAVAKGARLVPAMKNGAATGFKIYAIRVDSLFNQLGLENGDTILSVGGRSIAKADEALEAYTSVAKLKAGAQVEVAIDRRGTPVTLVYTLH